MTAEAEPETTPQMSPIDVYKRQEQGNEVIIAHGNGPQVGMINLGMATAAEAKAIKSDMPFPECGAMSQGYIGYHLQNAIGNELAARGMKKDVATKMCIRDR